MTKDVDRLGLPLYRYGCRHRFWTIQAGALIGGVADADLAGARLLHEAMTATITVKGKSEPIHVHFLRFAKGV